MAHSLEEQMVLDCQELSDQWPGRWSLHSSSFGMSFLVTASMSSLIEVSNIELVHRCNRTCDLSADRYRIRKSRLHLAWSLSYMSVSLAHSSLPASPVR